MKTIKNISLILALSLLISACNEDGVITWRNGSTCELSYPLDTARYNQHPINPMADYWIMVHPASDSLQIDTCGQTDLDITYELYSSCDDPDTDGVIDPIQISISPTACDSNFYDLINGRAGEKLILKIPKVDGANYWDQYTMFFDEVGE